MAINASAAQKFSAKRHFRTKAEVSVIVLMKLKGSLSGINDKLMAVMSDKVIHIIIEHSFQGIIGIL